MKYPQPKRINIEHRYYLSFYYRKEKQITPWTPNKDKQRTNINQKRKEVKQGHATPNKPPIGDGIKPDKPKSYVIEKIKNTKTGKIVYLKYSTLKKRMMAIKRYLRTNNMNYGRSYTINDLEHIGYSSRGTYYKTLADYET